MSRLTENSNPNPSPKTDTPLVALDTHVVQQAGVGGPSSMQARMQAMREGVGNASQN